MTRRAKVKNKTTMAAIPGIHFHLFGRRSGEGCSFIPEEDKGRWDGPEKKTESFFGTLPWMEGWSDG
jgi:hypothetical protein